MNGLPDHAEQQIRRIVESEGLELVHIDFRRQGRTFLLRVDIDSSGSSSPPTLRDGASSTWETS